MSDLDVLEKRIRKDIQLNNEYLRESYDAYIKDGVYNYVLRLILKLKKGENVD